MKYICFVLLVSMVMSCGEKLIERPGDLIPKEEMIQILKELTIINSARNTNIGALHENEIDPTQVVFTKYGIDSVQFVTSDRYYASLPSEYEEMYIEIEKQLETQKEELTEKKRINDSLELAKKNNKSPIKKKSVKKSNDSLQ